jgi:3-deoxy-D-manno-octulosonic-acid transferase
MLNVVYLAVLLVASPWILWSAFRHGKYREGFAEKLWGRIPVRQGNATCVWLHAVSVGEVNLLATTIGALSRKRPDIAVVISTTTKTGYELAKKKYTAHTVFYCPLDFSWACREALRRVRPNLLVLAELELWPNLINAAKEQGARVAIVNGRLSDKSFRGYGRILPVVARLLRRIDLIAAQNIETAQRFHKLGARAEQVCATGSLKFDGAQTDRENPRSCELRTLAGFEPDDVVLLAGSTQAPEEEIAVRIYQSLIGEFPRLKLVLVPRHPQRFEEVAALLEKSGISWTRRSALEELAIPCRGRAWPRSEENVSASNQDSRNAAEGVPYSRTQYPVLLVDTVGELGAWWGTASIGFVGGSFGSRGGQNMLEPAAYGVTTCFGPNTWNFRDIVGQLLAVDGAVVVHDEAELAAFVRRALVDSEWAAALGKRARELVLSQQGATERTVEMVLPLIELKSQLSRAA